MKEDARTTRKVGIEHASYEVLKEALDHLVTWIEREPDERITAADFYELGLLGSADSEENRKKAARAFHIGMGSAKTMRQSFNKLGITKEMIREQLKDE